MEQRDEWSQLGFCRVKDLGCDGGWITSTILCAEWWRQVKLQVCIRISPTKALWQTAFTTIFTNLIQIIKAYEGRTHSLRVSTELCLTKSPPDHIRVNSHMGVFIYLCSLLSLLSYQGDCTIDRVCAGRIVFVEFELHGPLNCPLFYLSIF